MMILKKFFNTYLNLDLNIFNGDWSHVFSLIYNTFGLYCLIIFILTTICYYFNNVDKYGCKFIAGYIYIKGWYVRTLSSIYNNIYFIIFLVKIITIFFISYKFLIYDNSLSIFTNSLMTMFTIQNRGFSNSKGSRGRKKSKKQVGPYYNNFHKDNKKLSNEEVTNLVDTYTSTNITYFLKKEGLYLSYKDILKYIASKFNFTIINFLEHCPLLIVKIETSYKPTTVPYYIVIRSLIETFFTHFTSRFTFFPRFFSDEIYFITYTYYKGELVALHKRVYVKQEEVEDKSFDYDKLLPSLIPSLHRMKCANKKLELNGSFIVVYTKNIYKLHNDLSESSIIALIKTYLKDLK
jgi:hypothetical protein